MTALNILSTAERSLILTTSVNKQHLYIITQAQHLFFSSKLVTLEVLQGHIVGVNHYYIMITMTVAF